jgi:hypothetical protein
MAAPVKQSSRWGSFLQQAVAGVESRLDNILTEGSEDGGKPVIVAPAASAKPESGSLFHPHSAGRY